MLHSVMAPVRRLFEWSLSLKRNSVYPKFFCVLSSILFLYGCASLGRWDPALNLEIKPLPVYRGKPALARIHAPLGAVKVVGTVVVMGSPQLLFEKDKQGDEWYFYGTIP